MESLTQVFQWQIWSPVGPPVKLFQRLTHVMHHVTDAQLFQKLVGVLYFLPPKRVTFFSFRTPKKILDTQPAS